MFMLRDTAQSLDIDFVIDKIILYTPYGRTFKQIMRPFSIYERDELIMELDRVEKVVELIERQRYTFIEIRNNFKQIKDLRLTFERLEEGNILSVTELFEIKIFINLLSKLNASLRKLKWDIPEDIKIKPIPYLEELFDPQGAGTNTFYIYDEYSERLMDIRRKMREIENKISQIRKNQRKRVEEALNIKLRPNGEITLSKENKKMIDVFKESDLLIYSSETYMNITFKVKMVPEVDRLTLSLEELKAIEEEEEFKVREDLSKRIHGYLQEIKDNIDAIGKLDLLIAKGYHAIGFKCVRPKVIEENKIYIKNGRHIKVEQNLRRENKEFTPISLEIKGGVTCITGANMGGKTVALKLIGMLCAMAQYGLFVPADEMSFSMREYIFISVGDMQSVDMGLSTFGGEIIKIKEALKECRKKGLILIDELARGTNPKEGYAISKALINYLKDKDTITVLTTHFDGLANDKEVFHLQVRGLSLKDYQEISRSIQKDENHGVETLHKYMDYRLQPVERNTEVPKDAINISRLMGLDEEILKDAEKILKNS